jgi:hypothetical protein
MMVECRQAGQPRKIRKALGGRDRGSDIELAPFVRLLGLFARNDISGRHEAIDGILLSYPPRNRRLKGVDEIVAAACDHDAGMANVLTGAFIVKPEVRDFRLEPDFRSRTGYRLWSLNWISSVAGRVVLAEPGHGAKDIDR